MIYVCGVPYFLGGNDSSIFIYQDLVNKH